MEQSSEVLKEEESEKPSSLWPQDFKSSTNSFHYKLLVWNLKAVGNCQINMLSSCIMGNVGFNLSENLIHIRGEKLEYLCFFFYFDLYF